ncbi:MAG: DUF488 domain-containing protein [Desulfohalobiaceae bacterium]|nr:DUF488 domain-containing protein [Desulfohalobiaceae bacterium]
MTISIKRIYDPADEWDGYRVLVDRVWPRGMSKDKAALDDWIKELAPSSELRKWFGHDPSRWEEFKKSYFQELEDKGSVLDQISARAEKEPVTLLYAAKDTEHNNAVALKEYLERRMA